MTAHSFYNRRLLTGACAALAGLMIFLGIYAKASLQSRALQREMAGVQTFQLDQIQNADRGRSGKNPDAKALGL